MHSDYRYEAHNSFHLIKAFCSRCNGNVKGQEETKKEADVWYNALLKVSQKSHRNITGTKEDGGSELDNEN